jgi:chlorophyll synthase
MVLNDFKAIEGDRKTGLKSLPAVLGPRKAAWIACITMAVPPAGGGRLLLAWGAPLIAAIVGLSVLIQLGLMARLMRDPKALAPWYNATGVTLYVLGMLASAFAVPGLQ